MIILLIIVFIGISIGSYLLYKHFKTSNPPTPLLNNGEYYIKIDDKYLSVNLDDDLILSTDKTKFILKNIKSSIQVLIYNNLYLTQSLKFKFKSKQISSNQKFMIFGPVPISTTQFNILTILNNSIKALTLHDSKLIFTTQNINNLNQQFKFELVK